ncbi:hypothetical protein MMC07_006900 [Pseudocyphellaria aurata]|nr:hypothetical protein [Pseudocyphellaria aurata]
MAEGVTSSKATTPGLEAPEDSIRTIPTESSPSATLQDLQPSSIPEVPTPYTIFTRRQKRLLTVILILTMLASPLTATIYLPLLPLLSTQYRVSIQAINLTITLYIVFQAISPLFFATASDYFGRRSILLTTYALYTVASLGLALNDHSYAGLLILRALQSLGASAVLAIAFGVVADVCSPAERGSMLGPTQSAANVAVCVGPVLGGLVVLGSKDTTWVFWALVIFGGTVLTLVGAALPETARNVVGNGSMPATGLERTWWSLVKTKLNDTRGKPSEGDDSEEKGRNRTEVTNQPRRRDKFRMANPVACLKIIFWKDTSLVLWQAASPYAVWYCVQTSLPHIYKDIYGFNELGIGLSYLPGGFGTVLGGYANGKLMDFNYKATARQAGHTIDKISGDDLDEFPIERARARGSWYLLAVYICGLAGYGWSVVAHAHASVPLMLQFVLSILCTCFQQTFNALLVDIFPVSPSTAAAASTITRCALSAVAVAVLQPLQDIMGRGWFFVLLAALSGGGGLATNWAINARGMQWRQQRMSKEKEKLGRLNDSRKSLENAATAETTK